MQSIYKMHSPLERTILALSVAYLKNWLTCILMTSQVVQWLLLQMLTKVDFGTKRVKPAEICSSFLLFFYVIRLFGTSINDWEEKKKNMVNIFGILVYFFFNAIWNWSSCWSRWENLDCSQYQFQPIKFVNSVVPSPCTVWQNHIINMGYYQQNYQTSQTVGDERIVGLFYHIYSNKIYLSTTSKLCHFPLRLKSWQKKKVSCPLATRFLVALKLSPFHTITSFRSQWNVHIIRRGRFLIMLPKRPLIFKLCGIKVKWKPWLSTFKRHSTSRWFQWWCFQEKPFPRSLIQIIWLQGFRTCHFNWA